MNAIVRCPRCRKSLADSPAGALFCVFCGSKLSTSGDSPLLTPTVGNITQSHIPMHSVIPDDDDEPVEDSPPKVIGGYQLIRILGSGGQGSVYEAEQSDTGQRVAVKLLSTKYAGSAVSVERFRQEGRLASQITHPRCVFVYGADTDSGVPFIVMELMPGSTLKDLIDRRGPLPIEDAIHRIIDVIDGLIEAHRLGVIHRDVKPSNCFITPDDRVKVGDFGLSKSLVGSNPGKQLTTSGKFVGTVLFAPPEQIRGDEVGYDSDVYSVAATLYYLLSGQAPHQHESLTAVLAKAISEPPPSLRVKRPDVPKDLDRAVLKGLERDRAHRWQSLEEFRDALVELLPSRLLPTRPRSLIAAYLVDALIFVFLIQIPFEILQELIWPERNINITFGLHIGQRSVGEIVLLVLSVLYFALFEGILGWTPGKWLLRLRVVRNGKNGPPGLLRAVGRSTIFHVLWLGITFFPALLFIAAQGLNPAGAFACYVFGAGIGLSSIIALCNQLRRRFEYRGIHDFATDCRVVQRPFRVERRRMVSRFDSPLDRVEKPDADLPESVGGYIVRRQISKTESGTLVWVGEDRSLSRRVLIWLSPTSGSLSIPATVIRPTRLRRIGDGCMTWNEKTYEWVAMVAPAGAPLADIADPDQPIAWADARPILEQLTDEFLMATKDNTLPATMHIDQVWVDPSGRVNLLDTPIRNNSGLENQETSQPKPIDLIRQSAALALQGSPWDVGEPIRAPLPPFARGIADQLTLHDSSYRDLERLRRDLADSHAHPTRVTSGQRGSHLVMQWLSNVFPNVLGLTVVMSLLINSLVAFGVGMYAYSFERDDQMAKTPGKLAQVAGQSELQDALSSEHREETFKIIEMRAAKAKELRDRVMQDTLTPPERSLVNYLIGLAKETDNIRFNNTDESDQLTRALRNAHNTTIGTDGAVRYRGVGIDARRRDPLTATADALPFRDAVCVLAMILILFFMANRFLLAVAFRGGLTWLVAGLSIVHDDGTPCGRIWCGLRALVVWLPIALLCGLLIWMQLHSPGWIALRVILSIGLIVIIIAYPVIAIRKLHRPPQDQLMGTQIVPM